MTTPEKNALDMLSADMHTLDARLEDARDTVARLMPAVQSLEELIRRLHLQKYDIERRASMITNKTKP